MRRLAACLILTCSAMAVSAGSASAVSQGESKYVGKTKQHRTIRLKANAKHLRLQGFTIQLRCNDGSVLIDNESGFEPTHLRNGKFDDKQYGSTDTVIYKGIVRGKRITGTVRVRDRLGKVRCASPAVKFTAPRRGH